MKNLAHYWYTRNGWLLLLAPFSLLIFLAVWLRRKAYQLGLRKKHRVGVPVIIVGNITVGGTGKTPLVAWLAEFLTNAGYRPGIIARGYKGKATHWPQQVRPDSDPVMVGDEAVMLAGMTNCPMAVGPDRVETARALIDHSDCNLILSDDGLQHYALERDIEIAVIDGIHRFGNGMMLPAGPLREPVSRIQSVDLVVVNGLGNAGEHHLKITAEPAISMADNTVQQPLTSWHGQRVHAVAGLGNPARFFDMLKQAGLIVETHIFPDHYDFKIGDLAFGDEIPIIMTAKDAVKCRSFDLDTLWYVPISVDMPPAFGERLMELLVNADKSAGVE